MNGDKKSAGIILLILAFVFEVFAGAEHPLTNPGFEMGDRTGWEWHGEGWEASDNPGDAQQGKFAIVNVIEPDVKDEWRVIFQAMPTKPNMRYDGHVWIRAQGAEGIECYLEIQFLDDEWNVIGQSQSEHLKGSYPYTAVSIKEAYAPAGAVMVGIRGVIYVPNEPARPSRAWIAMDEFELIEQP